MRGSAEIAAAATLSALMPGAALAQWLGEPVQTLLPTGVNDVAVGHIDGDGVLDAFAADAQSSIYVLRNDGTGHFDVAQVLNSPLAAVWLEAGDLNSDGFADVAAIKTSSDKCRIFWSTGPGTYDPVPTTIWVDDLVYRVAIGDLDQDEHDDLVLAGLGQIEIYWGTGTGVTTTPDVLPCSLSPLPDWCGERTAPHEIKLVDSTGSGRLDILVVARDSQEDCSGYAVRGVARVLNLGNRSFGSTYWIVLETYNGPWGFVDFDVADLDGDDDMDVVTSQMQWENGLRSFLQTTSGTWVAGATDNNIDEYLTLADLDENGIVDMLHGGVGSAIFVEEGQGDGSFVNRQIVSVGMDEMLVAELDGFPGIDVIGVDDSPHAVNVIPNVIAPWPSSVESTTPASIRTLSIHPSVGRTNFTIIAHQRDASGGDDSVSGPEILARITDSTGRLIARKPMFTRDASNVAVWDGQTSSGSPAPSGVYWVTVPELRATGRIIITR